MTYLSTPGAAQSNGNRNGKPFESRVRIELERRTPGIVEVRTNSDNLVRVQADRLLGACAQNRFHYAPGDIDILPAGSSEQWEEFTPSTTLTVRLPESILRDAAEQAGLSMRLTGLEPRFQCRDQQIEHVAWALNAERCAGNPNGAIYSEFLATALAIHLLGRYRAPSRLKGGLAKHELRKVAEHIEENLDQELSLTRLAGLAGMSISHFGVQFKKSTGVPVHEYVIRRRIERAKSLLQESEHPVSRIALDVGFSHQSHLARWMRRLLGVTPGDVRRMRTERSPAQMRR